MDLQDLISSSVESALDDVLGTPQGDPVPADVEDLTAAAVIGFSGDRIRGTLGLACNEAALARIARHFGVDSEQSDDCLGEAANQLLGHIKRTWGRREVDISLSTPLVIRGISIHVCGRQGEGNWSEHHRDSGVERLTVWLDATPDVDLQVAATESNDVADQGDALFF